jgi:hypothetical protein
VCVGPPRGGLPTDPCRKEHIGGIAASLLRRMRLLGGGCGPAGARLSGHAPGGRPARTPTRDPAARAGSAMGFYGTAGDALGRRRAGPWTGGTPGSPGWGPADPGCRARAVHRPGSVHRPWRPGAPGSRPVARAARILQRKRQTHALSHEGPEPDQACYKGVGGWAAPATGPARPFDPPRGDPACGAARHGRPGAWRARPAGRPVTPPARALPPPRCWPYRSAPPRAWLPRSLGVPRRPRTRRTGWKLVERALSAAGPTRSAADRDRESESLDLL